MKDRQQQQNYKKKMLTVQESLKGHHFSAFAVFREDRAPQGENNDYTEKQNRSPKQTSETDDKEQEEEEGTDETDSSSPTRKRPPTR